MAEAPARPRIGVSQCLLGEPVRWDGGHKRNDFVVDELGRFAELVAVCPELEVGMGVPREPVRLERRGSGAGAGALRMIAPGSGADWSQRMSDFARKRVAALAELGLSGYVLKQGSPSCGLEQVRVYAPGRDEPASEDGRGLFAAELMRALPRLPVEEEGRLADARLREAFVERVLAHHRALAGT